MAFQRLEIADLSQTAEVRRRAKALAAANGFDEIASERVAIVATEATTNLLKHAGGGELLLGVSRQAGESSIDIMALDRGPGMNEATCRVDGFSTTGTPGTGLGAISRLSSRFDLYSRPHAGTVVFAQLTSGSPPPRNGVRIQGVQLPKPGEEVCGDQWGSITRRGGGSVVLADGLGHGLQALTAARTAVETMHRRVDLGPREMLIDMDLAMRHTRGAAVAIAEFDEARRVVIYSGLGNISARIVEPGTPARHMVSANGTAGVEARVVRDYSYPWPQGAAMVLHSDGLRARWDLAEYPGLLMRDPGVIAGVLMRDYCRHTDDATVVIVK